MKDFVPQGHAVLLRIRLRDAGDFVPSTRQRQVERKADNPLATLLGKQAGLNGNCLARSAAGQISAANAGVLALGIFAHDDPIHGVSSRVLERTGYAGQQADWSDIGVLIEALADGQPQPPQTDVVWNPRPADRSEVNGVEALQAIEAIVIHHAAGLQVVLAAPWEMLVCKPRLFGKTVKHAESFGDNFLTDAIARNDGDPERAVHALRLLRSGGGAQVSTHGERRQHEQHHADAAENDELPALICSDQKTRRCP